MNKSELLENYTAEQLAEMVLRLDEAMDNSLEAIILRDNGIRVENIVFNEDEIYGEIKIPSRFIYSAIVNHTKRGEKGFPIKCPDCGKENVYEIDNKMIKEIQVAVIGDNKSLEEQLDRSQTTITQIDEILEELFGVTHEAANPGEFKEILTDKIIQNIADFLPTEPIKVADMLISAEGEYECHPIAKAICGTDKGAYRIFDVADLRQIAEHLLVYCNHNEGDNRNEE